MAAARRRDKAGDHAAQAIVIYDLQRKDAFGLAEQKAEPTKDANVVKAK